MSGVTDPYQPMERKLGITRGCLEVLAEFRNPVAMVTKEPPRHARHRPAGRRRSFVSGGCRRVRGAVDFGFRSG
jgi:hypothetical protein